MGTIRTGPPGFLKFVAVSVALVVVIASCATAANPEITSSTTDAAQGAAFEFVRCMRSNGIDDFPDPQVNGPGDIEISPPAGVSDEDLSGAEAVCEDILGFAGSRSESTGEGGSEWEKVIPGGDCECADNSEFAFWERRADPTKVVFYLDGGGVCFDAASCAFTAENAAVYRWKITNERPGVDGGIFDFERADNPFVDYSFVLVPLCTGDSHLGDVTREYSPELSVEHSGFVNGTAALDFLAENYPDASQVVVVGKTAGSVAAPVYGGLVADLLPDADVAVFGAQSGGFLEDPDLNAEIFGDLWGAYDNMPDWEVNDGLTARDWGPTQFWIRAGLHNPEVAMARFDYAYDRNAARALEGLSDLDGSDLLTVIETNEMTIEDAGVVQHSYTAPGDDHGILEFDTFYQLEVNGVRLVDWVDALLAGQPPDDVHCNDCQAP